MSLTPQPFPGLEVALREATELLQGLFEVAADGVLLVDRKWRIERINRRALDMLGYTEAALVGQSVDIIVPERFRAAHIAGRERFLGNPGIRRLGGGFEIFALRSDGSEFPVEITLNPLQSRDRLSILAVMRDLTGQMKSVRQAIEGERRLNEAQALAHVGSWAWDVSDTRVTWSDEMFRIYGLTPGQIPVTFEAFLERVHEDDRDRVKGTIQAALQTKKPFAFEHRVIRPDSSVRILAASGEVVTDSKGQPVRMYGAGVDITDRKREEERIRTSLEEKEVLLKEIHHRVKNNLQIITSLLHLQAQSVKGEAAERLFEESQTRVRAMSLIHDMLYKGKDLAVLDFARYVKDLAAQLYRTWAVDPANVVLRLDITSAGLDIDTAIPLGLILNELVSNALKHAFPSGKGTLRVIFHGGAAEPPYMEVADTGAGLPAGFEAEKAKTLGLQLVSTLVRQLGAKMEIAAANPGTRFMIRMPGRGRKKASSGSRRK